MRKSGVFLILVLVLGLATARREGEPSVKFGNYATEINILWPEIYLGDQSGA